MQDEFDTQLTVDGFTVAQGERRPARLRLGPEGIELVENGAASGRIAWRGAALKRDDADGALLVLGKSLTAGSTDPGFMRAIEGVAGNDIDRQLAQLEGLPTGWKGSQFLGCFVFFALLAVGMISVPGCYREAVDATVDQLPKTVDESLGEQAQDSLEVGEEIDDEEVTAAIQQMVDRLVPHFEGTDLSATDLTWNVRVVRNEQINAFALPGGYITVFSGLIEKAESPDTVAGILGHEMAHVLQRHGLKNIANRIGIFAGVRLLVGDAGGLIGLAGDLATVATASGYGRALESEADEIGLAATVRAGLDPEALGGFFEMLKSKTGDIPASLQIFASHPDHDSRIDALRAQVAGMDVPERRPLEIDWAAIQGRL